ARTTDNARIASTARSNSITRARLAVCRYAAIADQGQSRPGIEAAVVERAAGDGAGDDAMLRPQQLFDIPDAGKPARGDDGNGDRARERGGGRQVQARQDAVTIDVGVDDG